jgi:mevalonate kinase
MDSWRRATRTSRMLKAGNEVIREKMEVIQKVFERMEKSMMKRYAHAVRTEDKRWPKRIMT